MWYIDKLTSGDFNVRYPDNTRNGAPESEGLAYTDKNFPSAPTTAKAKPMSKVYAETDPIVDILDYITKIKGIELTNAQILEIITICS